MVSITILADNTVATSFPRGLRGEWGFSAVVDGVLFDTGQSGVAMHNAALLGVPTDFDTVVLSHTHWDHTGGLSTVLERMGYPTVYLHPDVWVPRYAAGDDLPDSVPTDRLPLGIPFTRDSLAAVADLVEHRDPVEVAEDIVALGEIPRPHPDTTIGSVDVDGELVGDDVIDDQALAVRTEEGLGLVLGCCHAGLRNTIEYAEAVCDDEVRYVIGGTHLVALEDEAVHEVADWLEGRLDLFAGTHCTGPDAGAIMRERFPDAFRSVGVGTTLELPPEPN